MTTVGDEVVRAFVDERVAPHAGSWDRAGGIDPALVKDLAAARLLASAMPAELGGAGFTDGRLGRLCEDVAAACSSTRSLLTVQDMVAGTLLRWGTAPQRDRWLPALCRGRAVAGFCLTEPSVGSDGSAVQAELTSDGDGWRLHGTKCWVTFGALADVLLVFARTEAGPAAVLVEAGSPGVEVTPLSGQLGLRAAHLTTIRFGGVAVAAGDLVGRPGSGVSVVAATALDRGRFTVACGCVGIARACLDASLTYTAGREQFGRPLMEHQLVRRLLSDMAVDVEAARLMCEAAAVAREQRRPDATAKTIYAKYFAARELVRIAADAVQVHGANGISGDFPVERLLRDAKVMQIIEGSDQMHQLTIAGLAEKARRRAA